MPGCCVPQRASQVKKRHISGSLRLKLVHPRVNHVIVCVSRCSMFSHFPNGKVGYMNRVPSAHLQVIFAKKKKNAGFQWFSIMSNYHKLPEGMVFWACHEKKNMETAVFFAWSRQVIWIAARFLCTRSRTACLSSLI